MAHEAVAVLPLPVQRRHHGQEARGGSPRPPPGPQMPRQEVKDHSPDQPQGARPPGKPTPGQAPPGVALEDAEEVSRHTVVLVETGLAQLSAPPEAAEATAPEEDRLHPPEAERRAAVRQAAVRQAAVTPEAERRAAVRRAASLLFPYQDGFETTREYLPLNPREIAEMLTEVVQGILADSGEKR